jgi:hypothetical protein
MVDLDAVRAGAAGLDRARGSAQARRLATLADGLAGSPQETRPRLLLGRAGLPALVAQFRVFDEEGFVARVDFAYPDLRIAIEYDGLGHSRREAFLRGRRRLNRLVAAGWTVLPRDPRGHAPPGDAGSASRLPRRPAPDDGGDDTLNALTRYG